VVKIVLCFFLRVAGGAQKTHSFAGAKRWVGVDKFQKKLFLCAFSKKSLKALVGGVGMLESCVCVCVCVCVYTNF
jgi:hypothetical protein